MTLRDYFAAKAMALVMPMEWERYQRNSAMRINEYFSNVAETSYRMSDAMLQARQKGGTHE